MKAIKLTYFNIEGAAEKVRLAFKLGGIRFEDHRVQLSAWPELKPKTPFGQLPLLSLDGKPPVAQSGAMLRYAGRLTNMYPTDADKAMEIDEVIGLNDDFARALGPSMMIMRSPEILGHPKNLSEDERKALQAKMRALLVSDDIPRFLGYFEGKLSKKGTGFFCDSKPTIADCDVLVRLRQIKNGVLDGVPTTMVDQYPLLTSFYQRMMALPAIQAHYAK